jgi:serine/threonine protein kinase/glycosyltransferase involved in cell wall biosynthesis
MATKEETMQEVQAPLGRGAVIQGRYIVESLLGKGDFGVTYLVREQHKLFVLAEVFDPNEEESYRFTFEYVAPASLDHQALPAVQYVFNDDKLGRTYILMGYIEEPNLEKLRLQQPEKRFPLPKVMAFMVPVIDTLNFLHHQSPPVIHQNVNPTNIIVSPTLHVPVLMMLDLVKECDSTTTTFHSFVSGYGAPEQYGMEISTCTDIYALGATCYTLLTGIIPPDALYRSTQLHNGEVDPLKPLDEVIPTLPACIVETIQRSMSLHADDRFPSVQRFKQAFQADLRFQKSLMQQLHLSLPEQDLSPKADSVEQKPLEPMIAQTSTTQTNSVKQQPPEPSLVPSVPTFQQTPMLKKPRLLTVTEELPTSEGVPSILTNKEPATADVAPPLSSELQNSVGDLNMPFRAETLLKTDDEYDILNNTQPWRVFFHKISMKTGFPDGESWSQENGHNGKVRFDTPELEEETLKLFAEEGPELLQPSSYDLTVVIPTRNERDNIMPLLHELQESLDGMKAEIIFVDDSDDDTPTIITGASVAMSTSMFHVHVEHRQPGTARAGGLATAVVYGMNRAQAEFVAVIDADLQHPPKQLHVFYDQAAMHNADLVIASRYIKGGSYQGLAGVGRRFISVGMKWTAKFLFPGQLRRISDPLGGFFLLRRSLLADVSLRPIGYKILLELLIRCPWQHVLEIPYHFQARAHGQSKATMQQGLLALQHMLRLWREVPAAGRIWKISILFLLNVLAALELFIINKSFPRAWANLNIVIIAVIAWLCLVLFNRFIFPCKGSVQRITIPATPVVDAHQESTDDMDRQDNTPVALTPSKKLLVVQPTTPFQAPRPVVRPPVFRRRRRLWKIAGVALLVVLILVSVRVDIIASASNDELLVQIANQSADTIDLRQAFPISPYLLGANVFPASGTDSLDQPLTGFMDYGPLVIQGLNDAHIHLLRFPGGNWGEEHLLSYDQLNSFSTLLSHVGSEGMVQTYLSGQIGTGLSSGQPEKVLKTSQLSLQDQANLAGQWVDYMNNPHSRLRTGIYGHAPFHPVKFWTVGNEPDLLLNPATGKRFTVKEYTNAFIQFSLIMHQNNPAIQVFGPEISQFYGVGLGPKDATGELWMEGFLKGVSDYEKAHPALKFHPLDGVSFHRYPLGDASSAPSVLLSSTNEWIYLLPPLRQLFRQYFVRDAPVAVTEINANPTQKVPTPGLAALWWADTLGSLMTQRVEYVAFFSVEGVDTPYPLLTTTLEQTAMLRVMQMYSYLQHNYIPVGTQHDTISLYATQDDTHQTLSLLFINKSSAIQSAQVSVKDKFLGLSAWPDTTISLFGNSLILVTLHRNGGAQAFSYKVPTNESSGVNPVNFTLCGNDSDVLSNDRPC